MCKRDDFGLISVIMAAYNAEKTIETAIYSVLHQTYQNFELLVIDDCSRDGTAEIVKHIVNLDHRVKLISNPVNSGVSFTRKHGLDVAKGHWIAILDSDDKWAPKKLEKQIELQKRTMGDLLFTGSTFMDAKGQNIDWYLSVPDNIRYRQLLKQNVISNSSVLVKKELYEKYYVMNDEIHEDFAIWLKILQTGIKAYGVNERLLIYRLDPSSRSGNKLKSAKMTWDTYRYMGLNVFDALYYEAWYMMKSIYKYRNLKKSGGYNKRKN